MADFSLRRSRKLLSPADIPLLIQPGPIHSEWAAAAEAKGFTLIARVRNHQHVALRCNTCGGITAVRTNVLVGHNPHCHHCLDTARVAAAEAAGLRFLHRDPGDHKYAFYQMACGHEVRRQFGRITRIATGAGAARCETCLIAREEAEALRFDWTRLGRDPDGNPSYRLYRHSCGHEQRIAVVNVRWQQCDCAACGESWTAKPSYIYLLDIRHDASARHYLKVGYSAHPVKRHKHQLGLPKDAAVEVLRVVAMPTGHDACAIEKAAHVQLGHAYPESVVPPEEFSDLMNVVSEIYRPSSASILHRTLDQIEAEIEPGAAIRALVAETGVTAPLNSRGSGPASALSRKKHVTGTRRSGAASGLGHAPPILRRQWGLSG